MTHKIKFLFFKNLLGILIFLYIIMLWHIEDYKIIIKIPPKTGCTSVKQFLCTLKI
jgi:hypothetical protein